MTKYLSYILALLTALMLPACSDETDAPRRPAADGEPVTLTLSAEIPELTSGVGSRSFIDIPTADYVRSLAIHIFVFDESGVMLQYARPTDVTLKSIDEINRVVTFTVANLFTSSNKRILHIIATTIDDLTDDSKVGGAENIRAMANENTSMANLIIGDNNDAYWARVELDAGINDETALSLRLLRNFAKITVEYSPSPDASSAHTFSLLGISVANRPNIGTIAPFQFRDNFFAKFFNDDKEPITYDEIRRTGYFGVNPAGVDESLLNTTAESIAAELARNSLEPVYFYERSQSGYLSGTVSDNLTYIIVKGLFDGEVNYYRIDIGADDMGRFTFFDILRNFQYTLHITEVGGPGAKTVEEAINAPAHNNLSTSVVTKDLFSIGYDNQRIEVSTTSAILVTGEDYDLRFRYTLSDGSAGNPAKLFIYDPTDELDEISMSGCQTAPKPVNNLEGAVISSAKVQGPDAEGWYTMTITPKDAPTAGYRDQNIRIYYKDTNGLGRTVSLQRRQPWNIGGNGLRHDNRSYTAGMTAPAVSTITGAYRKDPVNIYTFLPAGMGESIFPLTLLFESDKQNVYAHPEGPLTVTSLDRSGFTDGTSNRVIAYERRIEWNEYRDAARTGMWLATPFLYNTTLAEDQQFSTARLDRADDTANPGRVDNNGTGRFAMRISNPDGYINDIIDNILRMSNVSGSIVMRWNTNPAVSATMPTGNDNPYAFRNSVFTLYYQLPAGIPEEAFAGGPLTISINSTTDMALGSLRPDNLTAVDSRNFTQSISYERYQQSRVLTVPVMLTEAGTSFNVSISAPLVNTATEIVTRRTYGAPELRWTISTDAPTGTSSTWPGTQVNPYRYRGANWMLYYRLPAGLPESLFADGGMAVTLTSSINMLTTGNTPDGLTGSARTFSQVISYDRYSANRVIAAPFILDVASDNFNISVAAEGLDAVNNTRVTRQALGTVTLRWNTNTSATPADFPNRNTNPGRDEGSPWMLYYQLPANLPKDFFGDNGVMVSITASGSGWVSPPTLTAVDNRDGLSGSDQSYTQRITYERYLQNRVICAPFTLSEDTGLFTHRFNIAVAVDGLDSVSGTVNRG